MRAQPNAAHRAIAALTSRVPKLTLVTQNVDDLHERAGSEGVLHLHGSLSAPRCSDCDRPASLASDVPDEPEGRRRIAPPRCPHCGGRVRPGVVWFGEMLPEGVLQQAFDAARSCDLLLSIGTSSVVFPAAQIPVDAHRAGAKVIQINPNATDLDAIADLNLRGTAAMMMPALVRTLSTAKYR
jgi:NAD-dependent deacetylase